MDWSSCLGYPRRTNAEVRRLAAEYQTLEPEDREDFFREHGVRWSEFVRLPYFDMVRMGVIDPMHNLFLGELIHLASVTITLIIQTGVVKTHWYKIWIQGNALRANTEGGTKRELDLFHDLMGDVSDPTFSLYRKAKPSFHIQFESPPWAAHLPKAVGEPAGGSLTADEYKALATTIGPIVVSLSCLKRKCSLDRLD